MYHRHLHILVIAALLSATASQAIEFESRPDASHGTGTFDPGFDLTRLISPGFANGSYLGEAVGTGTNGVPFVLSVRALIPLGAVLRGTNIYTYNYSCSASARTTTLAGDAIASAATFTWSNSDRHVRNGALVTFAGTSVSEREISTTCAARHRDACAMASGTTHLSLADPGRPAPFPYELFLPFRRY